MLRNLLTITLRVLWRQKLYATINLLGLAIALALTFLVLAYVRHEAGFDRFHENLDRLVQMNQHEIEPGRDPFGSVSTPFVLADALREHVPGAELVVRYAGTPSRVRAGERSFDVGMHFTDPGFLQMFSFPRLEGSERPLASGDGVVMTESFARRVLGNGPWVGERVLVQINTEEREFRVAAVTEDPPSNSSLQFELLVPFEQLLSVTPDRYLTHWQIVWPDTYVLLEEGVDRGDFEQSLTRMYEAYEFEETFGAGALRFTAKPLADIHFHTEFDDGPANTSNPAYPRILLAIAGLILMVTAVNYTSLALGRSLTRSREVGLRKVLGAHGSQLRRQFLGEALLITFIAAPLALGLAELALPAFSRVVSSQLSLVLDLPAVGALLALLTVLGLAAGVYPALVLSRLRPAPVLKGTTAVRSGTGFLRGLLVLQFTVAALLLAGALMMGRQLTFMTEKDLGFEQEHVVVLPTSIQSRDEVDAVVDRFKHAARSIPGVVSVSASSERFGEPWGQLGFRTPEEDFREFHVNTIDDTYLETMGLTLVDGRNLRRPDEGGEAEYLVNEAFVRAFGWEQPVGQQLPSPEFEAHTIVGVVEDFHFQSLHHPIGPLMLLWNRDALRPGLESVWNHQDRRSNLIVRLAPGPISDTMRQLEAAWSETAPDEPFAPRFVEDGLNAMYQRERTASGVVRVASLLAVVIAGLGLLGLVSLSVARRTKEIGVRKVLGADVPGLLMLLAREYTGLIVLGSLIAFPLCWWAMQEWLANFAYRTSIHPGVFVAALGGMLLIAWLTVLLQAWRVTRRSPVHALRHE